SFTLAYPLIRYVDCEPRFDPGGRRPRPASRLRLPPPRDATSRPVVGGTVLWLAVVIGSWLPCTSWTDLSIPFSQSSRRCRHVRDAFAPAEWRIKGQFEQWVREGAEKTAVEMCSDRGVRLAVVEALGQIVEKLPVRGEDKKPAVNH